MSGICGVVLADKHAQLTPASLVPMLRALDVLGQGNGLTVSQGAIGIGAQRFPGRLAGTAKIAVQEQALTLGFHGSLYNLQELLPAEEAAVDPFTGLLHLYLQAGIGFVQRLRGEFALALWDGREETLYLATDRFRVHPLFYAHDRHKLVFASRLQGLLACPFPVHRTLNPEALVDMVESAFVPTPKTIFREVQKLPPGQVLTYHHGNVRLTSYWEPNFLQPDGASEAELARNLKIAFSEAVALRFETDGVADRIGAFLSGGVDSSTVTGVLTQLAKRPIDSFSIGFAVPGFNEIHYARLAAQAFQTESHEYVVSSQDVLETIPILLDSFDEPYGNASAIPTYLCAQMAREHGIEILYAGDGGDELFAGNERYAVQRLFAYYDTIPLWPREFLVQPLVDALARMVKWESVARGKKYVQRASIPCPERFFSYGFFHVVPMRELFTADFMAAVGEDYDPHATARLYYFQAPAQTELDRQLYMDLKLAISDNDLLKVTRMTEAAGVTVRFPFLDQRVVECATTVPASMKMRGRQLRSFFKKAYADLLPEAIRTKKKHGFGLPIPVWLRTDKRLNEMLHDLVLSPGSVQRGYFQQKALEELVKRHATDETSFYGTILWHLMMLELWQQKYMA